MYSASDYPPYLFPTVHRMTRRAHFHDYNRPGWYLITIVTKDRKKIIGDLAFNPYPHIRLLPFGEEIMTHEKNKIPHYYPNVHVISICPMPDHLHMIIWVNGPMPPKRHLGHVLGGFKNGCNKAYRRITGQSDAIAFENGYNDRILLNDGQLSRWKKYLIDNPRRLAETKAHPNLFEKICDATVAGHKCQMVGNRYLLDVPDIEAVIVHRADSDAQHQANVDRWLECGARGGVLISAAVSKREKDVIHTALESGHAVIWLRNNGFPPLYKPSGRAFDACASGQLLQISPFGYDPQRKAITRQECLLLNRMAESIALTAKAPQAQPTQ